MALHYGYLLLNLIDNGYVLFSAHPQLSANLQANNIRDQLSKFQSDERKSQEASLHRNNSGKLIGAERLLRVFDAYEQEGICTGKAKHGIKSEIGRVIYGGLKSEKETQWNKEVDAAYKRALTLGMKVLFS